MILSWYILTSLGGLSTSLPALAKLYNLSPSIFSALHSTQPGALGEIQLTDAIAQLIELEPVYGLIVEGDHYDVGTPHGLLACALNLAMKQPTMRQELAELFKHWNNS